MYCRSWKQVLLLLQGGGSFRKFRCLYPRLQEFQNWSDPRYSLSCPHRRGNQSLEKLAMFRVIGASSQASFNIVFFINMTMRGPQWMMVWMWGEMRMHFTKSLDSHGVPTLFSDESQIQRLNWGWVHGAQLLIRNFVVLAADKPVWLPEAAAGQMEPAKLTALSFPETSVLGTKAYA